MPSFTVRSLDEATWPDFAALVERHSGVWGGCWCLAFHEEGAGRDKSADQRRASKALLVRSGRAHAALVYNGALCVGWCQFGPTEELPRIKHLRRYIEGIRGSPDWRITCFFVDKAFRGQGVAAAALRAALSEIAQRGGGLVESYPDDTDNRSTPASFLHNATLTMFEREGFVRDRRLGTNCWVVTRCVEAQQ